MSLYAIGDVQGCYDSLRRLLDTIKFDSANDELWFTGDLVNRGSQSASVLRFVRGLGTRAVSVLGNHDLHLLATASGARDLAQDDTFGDVLIASDRDELLQWLATRPLLHKHAELNLFIVHAGVPPQWNMMQAEKRAREVEAVVRGRQAADFFRNMYGNEPDRWDNDLRGWDRLRFIVNVFTRLRFCYRDGRVDFEHKGPPGSQPSQLIPWFAAPARQNRDAAIVFGHWSLLGRWTENGVIGIDTGCNWGRQLTCVRLDKEEQQFFSVECRGEE